MYILTLECNEANKLKKDKIILIKPNNPPFQYKLITQILLTCISNVTYNPQIVMFDSLPLYMLACTDYVIIVVLCNHCCIVCQHYIGSDVIDSIS